MNNFLLREQTATFSNAVKSIIGRTCIVDFGIVKKVYTNDNGDFLGVVQVLMSSATNASDIRILNCTLLNVSSKALMVNTIPSVDDKVLVLFPRRFNEDMFNLKNNEALVGVNNTGYTPFSGIAILANQFRPSDYQNTLEIKEGTIKLHLPYADINVTEDSVNVTDTNSNSVTMNGNGISLTDTNSNSVTMNDDGISLNALGSYSATFSDQEAVIGKLTIKK